MSVHLLTVNGGSSSLKFAVFAANERLQRGLTGVIERIGLPGGTLRAGDGGASPTVEQPCPAPDHAAAVAQLVEFLDGRIGLSNIAAVGHRIVHGGERYVQSSPIDEALIAELRRLSPLDPAHLPGEIAIIEGVQRSCPGLCQFACFDTAFHRDLPRVAQLLPLPRRYAAAGIRRYGFHGLSYTYLLEELARIAGPAAAQSRIVFAHLGAGCSLAAVRDGKCRETTMGFTPTSGLVMGRRSGDVDPGALIHLLRQEQLTVDQLDDLLNHEAGLLGLSETSPDVRDLLARERDDPRAAEAVDVFCYQARKWIAACAAAIGGLDTLVFSAGIGQNSPVIRSRICSELEFLGVTLDEARNGANGAVISATGAPVVVRVIRTDEEVMIARDVLKLLAEEGHQ